MTDLPKVGMRMMKTAVAVGICFFIDSFRTGVGTPIFSAIAAIICMQPYVEHSVDVAFNRVIGTVVGAVFGLLASLLVRMLPLEFMYLEGIIISIAVIPVLYTTVLLKKPGASALAAVVLLSITLSDAGTVPLVNAINRSVETIIGIVVSLGVNVVHLPRRRENEILFVSGFDGALFDEKMGGISPYSLFELNQLLKDGLAFTVATERTPASLLASMGDIKLNLPVIAMDGAVLYDMKEKRYLACQGISPETTKRIEATLTDINLHYFLNVVWQDVLLIYYQKFRNEEEEKLYEMARLSPHRNYVYGERPEDGIVVYFLLVLENQQADIVEERLRGEDAAGELLFLRDKSETPEDYCHLKVYHRAATKEYMINRLLEKIDQKKIVVFGGNGNDISMLRASDLSYATVDAIPEAVQAADYQLKKGVGDSVVRTMLRLYEPFPWQKLPKELRGKTDRRMEDR